MEKQEAVQFLFTIAKEFKHFLETPALLLTRVDYADKVFDVLCEMRTALLLHNSTEEVRYTIGKLHESWLQAVQELDTFKKQIKDTPRESIYGSVDFTMEAISKRMKYFKQYIDSLEARMSEEQSRAMQSDLEIIDDMNTAIIAVLQDKKICLKNFTDTTEFELKVTDECQETLNWLDSINDSVALRFSELIGGNIPELSNRLRQTLLQVLEDMQTDDRESVLKLMDDLHATKRTISDSMRTHNTNDLEISKVMEKIATLNERIKYLPPEHTSALMALRHKKLYLEERLKSMMDIHSTLVSLKRNSKDSETIKGVIFNNMLPAAERERLVKQLVMEWDEAIKKRRAVRKSIISILSVAELNKEMYSDEMGRFYVDQYGRKLYTKENEDTMYQVNENHELVALADEEGHIYFYDECGRYYQDEAQQRVYKSAPDASEYMLDASGVMFKVREEREGLVYQYDGYGRHYVDARGRRVYRETDSASEYEDDGLGNLVRVDRGSEDLASCPDENLLTEESRYIRQCVGDALKVSVADTVLHQPSDPILYLAKRLLKYRADVDEKQRRAREKEEMMAEREARIQAERDEAERLAALQARLLVSPGGSETSYDSNLLQYRSMLPEESTRSQE